MIKRYKVSPRHSGPPFRARHPRIAAAGDWLLVLAVGVSMGFVLSGCAAAKVLFLPGPCHLDEIVQAPDGSFFLSPNPCRVPGHP